MGYDDRPRRTPAATLALAIVAGVALGVAVFYYFNTIFNRPVNDPTAKPREAELRAGFDAEEAEAIQLFKGARECVVNVDTVQLVRQIDMTLQPTQTGTGSGFVWDDSGRIVTNYHVIQAALNKGAVRIVLADRSSWEAKLVGVAPDYDLAVLQVSAPRDRLKPIRVGTSRDLEVGQKVFAIGNPFGLSLTMTKGIISALDREINSSGDKPIAGAIQTDAPINPGNSGGPLLDRSGALVGVNTSIASPSCGNVGIGFAIPVDTVNEVVTALIRDGKLTRPDAGLKLLDQRLLAQNGIRNGAMIAVVAPGGPAANAGLNGVKPNPGGNYDPGDLITALDGEKVGSNVDYFRALGKKKPGDRVKLSIERDKKLIEAELTLRGI